MADSVGTDEEDDQLAVPENDFDRLSGLVADAVVGGVSGFVGLTLLTGTLLIAEQFGGFDSGSFATLAELANLGVIGPPIVLGFLIYAINGIVTWPLLFASLKRYLPGTEPVSGVVFGVALWTGFVLGFYDGYSGTSLLVFLVATLVGHVAYGFSLGVVFRYFTNRPRRLV